MTEKGEEYLKNILKNVKSEINSNDIGSPFSLDFFNPFSISFIQDLSGIFLNLDSLSVQRKTKNSTIDIIGINTSPRNIYILSYPVISSK